MYRDVRKNAVDYMPPAYVQQVGDSRWTRYIVRDAIGQYWMGEQRWSSKPTDAALFCREVDAIETMKEHCLRVEA